MNATGVTAGPAESSGRLLLSKWRDSLHVTCGLTACTPRSAPGPTLGNEYGKTLPLPFLINDRSRSSKHNGKVGGVMSSWWIAIGPSQPRIQPTHRRRQDHNTKVMASDGTACRILIRNEQLKQLDTFRTWGL